MKRNFVDKNMRQGETGWKPSTIVHKTKRKHERINVDTENEPVFVVEDIRYGSIHTWTMADILNEINKDRLEGWEYYDETDFFKLNLLRFVWGLRFFCHRIVEEPSALGTISTLG